MSVSPGWRGGLLLFFVLLNGAEGCPLVPNIQPYHLEGPIGARELARWGERLRGLGLDLSDQELADDTLAFSARSRELHGSMLGPFLPGFALVQVHQKWSLFPIADPDPWWLHIEGRAEGRPWRVLYRPLGPSSIDEELRARLEYRRVRAHWNPGTSGPRADYLRFVDWVSAQIFAADPELSEVRVRYQRFHVQEPGEPEQPGVTWHFDQVRSRP